jgi:hypothetical protein
LAGVPETSLSVDAAASCADLKRELALRHPPIAALVKSCAVGTDSEFLQDAAPLGEITRFHLIPPVSGG